MAPIPKAPVKFAILDDYQGIAEKHFEPLKTRLAITVFGNTLLPYNHAATPDSVKKELVERLRPFAVISSMRERTPFPAELLKELPNLKLLLTTGNRNNGIDVKAAKALGIPVSGAPTSGRSTNAASPNLRGPDSTTQHCIALILGLARGIAADDLNTKSGGPWQIQFATGLSGKTLGVCGLGRLGGNVSKIMYESFGMRVICWSSSLTQEKADDRAKELGLPIETAGEKTFKVVDKHALFKEADVLSVHYVLSDRSRGIVAAPELALMKESALLVNTSRGPLIDEPDLLEVLEKGRIRGAAIDVFEIEPLGKESKWRSQHWGTEGRSNVLLTPHMGYVEKDSMEGWYDSQAENLERWIKGEDLLHVLS